MIELHYIDAIIFALLWIASMLLCYYLGLKKAEEFIDGYRDTVDKWGETIQHYKELHSQYKKLLDEYKESQSKIHMN